VAAALWRAGELTISQSHALRRPQGLYCGIGRCGRCLATVDGEINRPLCLEPCRPGLDVRRQGGDRPRPVRAVPTPVRMSSRRVDVLVIGAGATGRAVAARLSGLGAEALVLDERPWRAAPGRGVLWAQALGVWDDTEGVAVWTVAAGSSTTVTAAAVVLATGAVSVPHPVEGGLLPGVLTADGLGMLREVGVDPGPGGALVAGSGMPSGWPAGATRLPWSAASPPRVLGRGRVERLEQDGRHVTAAWVALPGVAEPALELWRAWRGGDATPGAPRDGWWQDGAVFVAGRAAGEVVGLPEAGLDALCHQIRIRLGGQTQ
jgi:hypothetical protein